MAGTDYKFEGWLGMDKSAAEGNMVWGEFEPKVWEETDVDLKVTHCGVCGTDLHTLRSGWAPTDYPCCVGHEIVGHVVRVGSQVADFKIGDRVGVGAQSDACFQADCAACSRGLVVHCPQVVMTYNALHLNGTGKSYGGYATYKRCPARLVVHIPEELSSADAAPMLCGGITTFVPLKIHGAGPGKSVGVVGVGGLGHMAIMWAKALGADKVVAISRSSSKKADALKMGADAFVATAEDPDWVKTNQSSVDLIVCTVGDAGIPIDGYLAMLRFDGVFVQVGVPEEGLPSINVFHLLMKRISITTSLIGTPADIRDMLDLAVAKKVHPWVQQMPMKDANKALVEMEAGKSRFRYVLVNEQ